MYDFTEVDTAYLNNRYTFLSSLIEALEKSAEAETDSIKARNLSNSLLASKGEFEAVKTTLSKRAGL